MSNQTTKRADLARMIDVAGKRQIEARGNLRTAMDDGRPMGEVITLSGVAHEADARCRALCEVYEIFYGVVASPVEIAEATR